MSKPYFRIKSTGWAGSWSAGETIEIDMSEVMNKDIEVTINNVKRTIDTGLSLRNVGEMSYRAKYIEVDPAMCIAAVNGELWPEDAFDEYVINNGDKIDFLPIMVGG